MADETVQASAGLVAPAYGITMINDQPSTSLRYERREDAPEALFDLQFMMGRKRVASLEGITQSDAERVVGGDNWARIAEGVEAGNTKGVLTGESLTNYAGLTPAEVFRRQLEQEERQAQAERAAAETSAKVADLDEAEATNEVERDVDPEPRVIEPAEFLARTAFLRARDREALRDARGSEQSDLPTGQRSLPTAESLPADKAQRAEALEEVERQRRAELLGTLHAQFRVDGSRYLLKDQPGKIAFKDRGDKLLASSNDERIARAMATMADAKGWKALKVKGHPEFVREVWLEASLRGIEVRGYKPKEHDLKELEDRREAMMHNFVERDPEREQRRQASTSKEAEAVAAAVMTAQRATAIAENVKNESVIRTPEADKPDGLRTYSGRVLDHGRAPFNFDKDEKQNYFVKLETSAGEQFVWGKDIERAMTESSIRKGDNIRLDFLGSETVKVQANVRDKAGKVVGTEEIETVRNTWRAEKTERAHTVEAVAQALVDAKITNPDQRAAIMAAVNVRLAERQQQGTVPPVHVYDKAAPSQAKATELAQPQQRRNMERAR